MKSSEAMRYLLEMMAVTPAEPVTAILTRRVRRSPSRALFAQESGDADHASRNDQNRR
ncbi:MAG: hypothetical protein OJF52_001526 [Nitrospira sp.]|nr:MAG: hypothetical protein OJF52_001526 [Nitrospira sp.]